MEFVIVGGLATGAIYSLIALGFYITWITHKSVSFAQGELLMIGAFFAVTLYKVAQLHYLVALAATVVALATAGLLIERVAVRPTAKVIGFGWLISTLGVGLIIKNIAVRTWGGTQYSVPSPLGDDPIRLGAISLSPHEALVFGVALCIVAGFILFLKKTLFGKALEAVAFNRETASLMGINPTLMVAVSYMVAAALAGLAGFLIAPLTFASANMGFSLLLKSFVGALLGCLENPLGIVVGSIIIGLVEALTRVWFPLYGELSGVLALIIILAIRPEGLLARTRAQRV